MSKSEWEKCKCKKPNAYKRQCNYFAIQDWKRLSKLIALGLMFTLDPTRCPICHEPNVCAMEKAKATDTKPERCWCMDAVFTPAVMDLVPEQAQGKACICAKCASNNWRSFVEHVQGFGLTFLIDEQVAKHLQQRRRRPVPPHHQSNYSIDP